MASKPDIPRNLARALKIIEKLTGASLQVSMCLCDECQNLWEAKDARRITITERQLQRHWNVRTTVVTRSGSTRPITFRIQPLASGRWTWLRSMLELTALIVKEQYSIESGPKDETLPTKLG